MNWLEFLKDKFINKVPKGARRHKDWRKVRKKYLALQPTCEACGCSKNLQVHHLTPYWLAPELELEFSNLVTLCMYGKYGVKCHLFFGHHGNWQNINFDCNADVAEWNIKLKTKETK